MEHLLECPNCHRTANGESNGARQRCPVCGSRLIMSMREKEAEVRERLYGHPITRPVTWPRERDPSQKAL
jgi:DNA-directed RNA polymerase subunit RPC12/RpoP